ncbi:hemin receptor [Halioglobus sp. HI00S01]|uniref:globin family protein n=1 Tax=Halioglobus sp. HI00S01 TaxID=1822214 RepID=UPI0007C3A29F|nr:globin family protein [Halioglobus sp. HI00S01]KZX57074.1 hemin receptor [Halioglobus sp. HI00S01]
MPPEQIHLVKTALAAMTPIAEQAADTFYARLFEQNPPYRALFTGDMRAQGKMLIAILNTTVMSIDRREAVVPAIQALGKRHVGYGVTAADYDAVGEALLWTLARWLGEAFTPDTRTAWTTTYSVLADTMNEAAARTD